jgi:hypothetical protein
MSYEGKVPVLTALLHGEKEKDSPQVWNSQ